MNATQMINVTEDICPVSDFRADTAAFITKIKSNKRPLVLTQHGKCAAVVISSESYQAMVEKMELLEDIANGEADVAAGRIVSHAELKKQIMARFSK